MFVLYIRISIKTVLLCFAEDVLKGILISLKNYLMSAIDFQQFQSY